MARIGFRLSTDEQREKKRSHPRKVYSKFVNLGLAVGHLDRMISAVVKRIARIERKLTKRNKKKRR